MIVLIALVLVSAVWLALRDTTVILGRGGIRQPTVLVPDSISIVRYYDIELDLWCLIFTKRFIGEPYYDITVDCLPASQVNY